MVYVRNGSSFEPREVKIHGQNESRVALEGVAAGTEVAMVDPTAPRKSTNAGTEVPGGGRAAVVSASAFANPIRALRASQQWLPDLQLGFQNLLLHRLRTALTMMGMIFGVAAVVSMLSIGAGARQRVMAFIEQMGVHNLIVEAKEIAGLAGSREDSQDFSRADLPRLPCHPR